MSIASRLVTALVGVLLIWFFWPFGESEEVVQTVTPPPTGHERLFTTKLPEETPPKLAPRAASPEAAPPKAAPKTEAETDGEAPEAKTLEDKTPDDKTPDDTASEDKASKNTKTAAGGVSPKLKPKRFYRVRVLDSGTLEASGRVIKLDGINPIPSDETCNDKSGTKWLCGTRARLALTRFIRGRAVVCKVPEKDKAKALTARCSLASKDLSVWVAAQGWAKPAAPPKPKIAKAADQARKKKIGIWR